MRKGFILFVFVFSCWALILSQGFEISPESIRCNREFRYSGDNGYFVIKLLRASQDNDSIGIDIFKNEYEIVNMRRYDRDWLFWQNHVEIIQFFALEKNKKYHCQSKRFKGFDPVLLTEYKLVKLYNEK